MTAILKRGDKIHMAIGIDAAVARSEYATEARRLLNELNVWYHAQGVEIVSLTCNTGITCPAVVAIFREEES